MDGVEHGRRSEACLAQAPSLSGAVTRDLPPPVAYRTWLVLNLAMLGDFPAGIALGQELDALVASMDWPRARLSAAGSMGSLLLAKGDLAAAISLLEPALRLCREAELWAFVPRIASALGTALACAGRAADGLVLLEGAAAQSRSARFLYDYAAILCALGTAHLAAGHLDESRRLAAEALAVARAQGARGSEAAALRLAGQVATQSDPFDEAAASARLREALDLNRALGARPAAADCHLALGALHRRAGHLEQARTEVGIATLEFRAMAMTNPLARAEGELNAGA
jgi:tetratricopeptide (TPR) repeat protein